MYIQRYLEILIALLMLLGDTSDRVFYPQNYDYREDLILDSQALILDLDSAIYWEMIDDRVEDSDIIFRDGAYFLGNILYKFSDPYDDDESQTVDYIVPNGTIAICPGAFYGSEHLRSVSIPSSVLYIGMDAFGQSKLHDITFSEGLLFIGHSAFEGDFNINVSRICLPDSLMWIGSSAFRGCRINEGQHLRLPKSLVWIGEEIFLDGHSDIDDWTPIYEVYAGSYAHGWVSDPRNADAYVIVEEN